MWDEARKALAATDLAGDEGLLRVRFVQYERDLDLTKRVRREQRSQRVGITKNPFVSIPPESLATGGFIQATKDGTWYYAPDAEVLVSEEFLDNYCFRLQRGKEETASMIGVAFEPAKTNALPGIKGVLWVDAQTAELRHVEYVYTKLPGNVQSADVGGRIEFKRLPTGIWMVQRWRIRMPVVQIQKAVFRRQGDLGLETTMGHPTVVGFRDEGGEVAEIMGPLGRTFAVREGLIQGIAYDSTRSRALAGAEITLLGTAYAAATREDGTFEIAGIPEGDYTLTFFHPRLDTLGLILPGTDVTVHHGGISRAVAAIPSARNLVSVLCPGEHRSGAGALTGIVRDARGNVVAGATVSATWTGRWTGEATTVLRAAVQESSARSESDGRYRLCEIPMAEAVELAAVAPGLSPARANIPPRSGELLIVDLRIPATVRPSGTAVHTPPDPRATATAEGVSLRHEPGTGIVRGNVADASGQPIEAAQVRILGIRTAVHTMPNGTFSFALPPGSHVVDVRRVGYTPARFVALVREDQNIHASVRLEAAAQQLASIVIAEERGTSAAAAPGFAERKRRLNAVFVDRQRIDREQPIQLTDLLRGAPGIRLQAMKSLTGVSYIPQMRRASSLDGLCPMSYYVDGMEFEPSAEGINTDIRPAEIEALEVYQPSQVPAQFSSGRSARCGVLVIWTRQDAG
ncbi:MAG: carboxypeptidase regulatory-like domain-containing protein [Gemmatimonadaceae bacterium]